MARHQMEIAALRILDANFNRAREGLRVVEEFTRFVINNAALSKATKDLRHELTQAFANALPKSLSLAARNTGEDVGTEISNTSETTRDDTRGVAYANLARVAEALRSIEEYAKTGSADLANLANGAKALRYRVYQLESAIQQADKAHVLLEAKVMAILGGETPHPKRELVRALYEAGLRVFQLREKGASDAIAFAATAQWREALAELPKLVVLVNDRVDWALAL
ncbi:MAG: thiamine phosphate synthase, partial [Planctomycetes bacterium]|nr:thiamine phosphate synthase [Planctomycetota bacterium]